METEPITIRTATPGDAAPLLEIYAPYVEQTAISFEYVPPALDVFAKRIADVLKFYPFLVAEEKGEILGYVYASPFHPRPAYAWAVETSVYVRKDRKRTGIGKKLYEALEHCLALQNILNLNACIAETEHEDPCLTRDSILFHEKLGYRMVGQFRNCGYKFGRWYNMVWMEKHIGSHTASPEAVRPFSAVRKAAMLDRKMGLWYSNGQNLIENSDDGE